MQIILDTSIWIALIHNNDSCNQQALQLVKKLGLHSDNVVLTDSIYQETMTVLRYKAQPDACSTFAQFLDDLKIPIRYSPLRTKKFANSIFFQYPKLSFTDSLLIASALIIGIDLLTFDKSLMKAWADIIKQK